MHIIDSDRIVYVDIDNTLVLWSEGNYRVNPYVVTKLKEFKRRGHTVVGWSAGGVKWAVQAIRDCHLEEYFDLCVSKPDWYIDDLTAEEFLHETKRIDPIGGRS